MFGVVVDNAVVVDVSVVIDVVVGDVVVVVVPFPLSNCLSKAFCGCSLVVFPGVVAAPGGTTAPLPVVVAITVLIC